MKVAHLTSVHKVSDVRILFKECATLRDAGYEVSLIACSEKDQVINGIQIIGVRKYKNRTERVTVTAKDIYQKAVAADADVYHIHDPELIPVGALLRIRGKKIIYDSHEYLAKQIFHKSWIPSYLHGVLSRTVSLILYISSRYLFSGVVVANPSDMKNFHHAKTKLVCNFPILDEFDANEEIPYQKRSKNFVYVGGIFGVRGIREMVRSLESLSEEDLSLQLAGSFESEELEAEVSHMQGWKKVKFLGWIDREGIVSLLGNARAGLVLLHPTRATLMFTPLKCSNIWLQEYL